MAVIPVNNTTLVNNMVTRGCLNIHPDIIVEAAIERFLNHPIIVISGLSIVGMLVILLILSLIQSFLSCYDRCDYHIDRESRKLANTVNTSGGLSYAINSVKSALMNRRYAHIPASEEESDSLKKSTDQEYSALWKK